MKRKNLLILACLLMACSCSNTSTSEASSVASSEESTIQDPIMAAINNIDTSLDKLVTASKMDEEQAYRVNEACYYANREEYIQANGHAMEYDDSFTNTTQTNIIYNNNVAINKTISYEKAYNDDATKFVSVNTERQIYIKSDESIYWVSKDNLDDTKSFGSTLYTKQEYSSLGYSTALEAIKVLGIDPIGLNSNVKYYLQNYKETYGDDFVITMENHFNGNTYFHGQVSYDSILYYLPIVWPSEDLFPIFDANCKVTTTVEAIFNKDGICIDSVLAEQWYLVYSPVDGTGFDQDQYLYGTHIHNYNVETTTQKDYDGTLYDFGEFTATAII